MVCFYRATVTRSTFTDFLEQKHRPNVVANRLDINLTVSLTFSVFH